MKKKKSLCMMLFMGAIILLNSYLPVSNATLVAAQAATQPAIQAPPDGAPPGPPPQGAGGPGGPGQSSSSISITSAAYLQKGGTVTKADQTYSASDPDESGIYVSDGGTLALTGSTIATSGNTSSNDNSSFYGLNAAVLAGAGSTINLSNSTITTTGSGANGAFATGIGASVVLSKVTIKATGDGGHGVMATQGGFMTLTDVDMTTAGKNSGAIATDRGGGTITVTGGTVTTSGQDSPGIYSTGDIKVSDAIISATGAESAVIEGANSITLTNTRLSSSKEDKWGVMIYQSMSGDAEGTRGTFTMTGGSLAITAKTGPLFYITNSTGVITLKEVNVTAASGVLLKASTGNWGKSGSNGGTAIFTADGQILSGNMIADSSSALTLTLQNKSSLTGSINTDKTAKTVALTLDSSSTWNVTADSYLTRLSDTGAISGSSITNIVGNGHNVYYDVTSAANSQLGGLTYSLANGGQLIPMK